jgi:hypothetical protein
MLKSLKLHGVGPVPELSASFGSRLNVLTGDNGLGKSFLLDVCFWLLTGTWPGQRMALPDQDSESPRIEYEIESKTTATSCEAKYDFSTQSWSRQTGRAPMPGLVIYAAIDGSYAVWDPARNYRRRLPGFLAPKDSEVQWPQAFQFSPESWADNDEFGSTAPTRKDVANGLEEGGRVLCNGLIVDWSQWYYQQASRPSIDSFRYLQDVVSELAHPSEPMRCDEPRKVFLTDSRKFPSLQMAYGSVPYPQWSAGVTRVVQLAYLIVWAWVEHVQAAALRKEEPTDRIIVIVDEVEAHLHPKWQRTILPALLRVVNKLRQDVSVQMFAATHSPLVLASLEPYFDDQTDQFFCFELDEGRVVFENPPWATHGDVVAWLTSDVFGLAQARSKEAERVIEAAEAFMRRDFGELPEGLKTQGEITAALQRLLPGLDPFWPRWMVETKA